MLAAASISLLLLASSPDAPQALTSARRLSDQLRFEEAVVAYQRYLSDPNRPVLERARALLELGFVHLVLGDEANARHRTLEALALDPSIRAPAAAPPRQLQFLAQMRTELESRPKLEVLPRPSEEEGQQSFRVELRDPASRVHRVLLRHALARNGPFYGQPLRCERSAGATAICTGVLPPPSGVGTYTAWHYVEALDRGGNTLTQAASAAAPLQLSIIQRSPWYESPWVWGGGAALVVGVAAVIFATSGASAPR